MIYSTTRDNKARFLLGEKGRNTLLCIGVNPSTATPQNLDGTVKTVQRYSTSLGYDSYLMINLYPQRARNPNKLHQKLNKTYHQQNLKLIQSAIKNDVCDIWAAWGTLINKRNFLPFCLRDIQKAISGYAANWFTIGNKSKEGHPHHPLYLKNGLPLDTFDVEQYIAEQIK